jgi:hypothetical protein
LKKVLSFILISVLIAMVTGGFLVFERYRKNPEQIVPYPYEFASEAPAIKLDAPILITGDRMGAYLAKFKEELATTISVNLANSIKIQSIAKPGHGLHRTLHELRSLTQWPQILVYQGGSEEFLERKFDLSTIPKITTNFGRYTDDRIETFLILYPPLSRVVYDPILRVKLEETPTLVEKMPEDEFLKRLETELLLYEQQLIELATMSKNRGSLLILTTTPLNLDALPREVCDFTTNIDIEKEILGLRELLKANDPKTAYGRSSKLVKQYMGNASLYYIHGQIARRLGNIDEARTSLLEASAYDCTPWRATEIHNSIIRKVSKNHQIVLFDFARLVERDYTTTPTFFDEIYPQNLYYDKAMRQLGLAIKSILKL